MTLPLITSQEDLAHQIGITKEYLYRLSKKASLFYRTFTIQKKSRGVRRIYAPNQALKGVQRWILHEILEHIRPSQQAKGFVKGESILSNASVHNNQNCVLNIDIRDYFCSIRFDHVYAVYKMAGYSQEVAVILTRLTTRQDVLPQGGVTSPALSNLVCRILDKRINRLCDIYGFNYTRYADDITISGKRSPEYLLPVLKDILSDYGMSINERKTRLYRNSNRQIVTGLIVNNKTGIPRNQRKTYRAIFHTAKQEPDNFIVKLPQLKGYLSFLRMVHPNSQWIRQWKETISNIEQLGKGV